MTKKIILSIDPGAISGWCIWDSEKGYIESGFGKPQKIALDVVDRFVELTSDDCDKIVAIEKWTAGGWMSHKTLIGMGKNLAPWEMALEARRVPAKAIVRVYPQQWRSKVLGRRVGAKGDVLKAHAVMVGKHLLGMQRSELLDHNQAEAVCISRWAQMQPMVIKKMIKKTGGS